MNQFKLKIILWVENIYRKDLQQMDRKFCGAVYKTERGWKRNITMSKEDIQWKTALENVYNKAHDKKG
jgi:hypothetical protein